MTIVAVVHFLLGACLLGLALLVVAAMAVSGSLIGLAERVAALASWPSVVPGGLS